MSPGKRKADDSIKVSTANKKQRGVNDFKVRCSGPNLRRDCIEIHDFSYSTMHNFLYFCYTGDVNLSGLQKLPTAHADGDGYPAWADAYELFVAADYFGAERLRDHCFTVIESTSTPESILDDLSRKGPVLNHVSLKGCRLLRKRLTEYMYINYDTIKETVSWRRFVLGYGERMHYVGMIVLELTKKLK